MECASHESEHSVQLSLFMRSNGKCKPCVRALGLIESVHVK